MDREKVISLLERYTKIPNLAGAENYGAKIVDMPAPLIADVITLLKAQEPVEPILKREGWNKYHNDYVCPVCDQELVYEQNYCSECGRAVMWE